MHTYLLHHAGHNKWNVKTTEQLSCTRTFSTMLATTSEMLRQQNSCHAHVPSPPCWPQQVECYDNRTAVMHTYLLHHAGHNKWNVKTTEQLSYTRTFSTMLATSGILRHVPSPPCWPQQVECYDNRTAVMHTYLLHHAGHNKWNVTTTEQLSYARTFSTMLATTSGMLRQQNSCHAHVPSPPCWPQQVEC